MAEGRRTSTSGAGLALVGLVDDEAGLDFFVLRFENGYLNEVDEEREKEDEGEQPQADADEDAEPVGLLAHHAANVEECEHLQLPTIEDFFFSNHYRLLLPCLVANM
jgi:hypothetical protein